MKIANNNNELSFYKSLQDIRETIASINYLLDDNYNQNTERFQPMLKYIHQLLGFICLHLENSGGKAKTPKEKIEIKKTLREVNAEMNKVMGILNLPVKMDSCEVFGN